MEDYVKILIFAIIIVILVILAYFIFGKSNNEEKEKEYGRSSTKREHHHHHHDVENKYLELKEPTLPVNNDAVANYNNYVNTGIGNNVITNNGNHNNSAITNQLTNLLKGFYNNKNVPNVPVNSNKPAAAPINIGTNSNFCR